MIDGNDIVPRDGVPLYARGFDEGPHELLLASIHRVPGSSARGIEPVSVDAADEREHVLVIDMD